jgi:hypothetical protein
MWRKSSFSFANGNCVEVAYIDGVIHLRDSKSPDGPTLQFNEGEWWAFIKGCQAGEFDPTLRA